MSDITKNTLVNEHLKYVTKSSLACFEDTQLESATNHANVTQEYCIQYQHWVLKRSGLIKEELTPEVQAAAKALFKIFLNETKLK